VQVYRVDLHGPRAACAILGGRIPGRATLGSMDDDLDVLDRLRGWLDDTDQGSRLRLQVYSKHSDGVLAESEGWHTSEVVWAIRQSLELARRYRALVAFVRDCTADGET